MYVQALVIEMVGFSQALGQSSAGETLHLALIRDPSVGLLGPRMQRTRHW